MKKLLQKKQNVLTCLYTSQDVKIRVQKLASEIEKDYQGLEPVIIGVLKGAFVFLADLVRSFSFPSTLDFVGLSSYENGKDTSGKVTLTKPLEVSIEGRDVLVVEDILDTGLTMRTLFSYLKERFPRSIRICALIDKRKNKDDLLPASYVAFEIPEGFLVGYGLDYQERYRALPGIYRLSF